ncbi:uncharacterized protein TrAFT101_000218 [Trichoderma asperellum]|uniref:Cyanovirin-N domain-containing protein n=1 Tax=Trichoderma asperellum (strain ATCC 204424 / CBS 433.97 / NBRC 101777) TaxID=1042311 RepID=A0A2T3YUN8_TRIA4|nr:hypothetical protein M441DRAFT_178063 [Trichoderma asperellum CBS 433.97]PTB36249.1 hypothetical protein M441DRAFT_178063 [Trichoderma asperellum CBS 433.97]UKZ84306.1 hypothetical protein TrAFT101_000218 [Trichoderma asperellum]
MYASKIVASLGLFLGLATATVNIGKDSAGDTVAWIGGESECTNVFIAGNGANPCGINFTLNNGFTYHLVGCGGAGLSLDNGDGSFNSNCQFGEQNLQCGVQQQWSCF